MVGGIGSDVRGIHEVLRVTAPDEYSNAEFRRQLRGLQHQLTRMNSDWVDLWDAVKILSAQLDLQVEERERDQAAIGELRESLEKARVAFSELKKNGQPTREGG